MSEREPFFRFDGQIARYLPRGGATLKNPDAQTPALRRDDRGVWFLEMTFTADPDHPSEIELTRRIPLDNLSEEDWQNLQHWYANLDFKQIIAQGISNGLEKIEDTRVQRLFMSLLTFLNPRQVAVLIYLYRAADEQGSTPQVCFESNELLEALGYSRSNDGRFPAEVRAQLNRDLVALHRMELVIPDPEQDANASRAVYLVKNILRIEKFAVDKGGRKTFDWQKAADYTHELADGYTVSLGFFDTIKRGSDYLLLSKDIDLKQKPNAQASRNYRMKLQTYLWGRMAWDDLQEGQYLNVSLAYLLKHLELFGNNKSRNKAILYEVIEELKREGEDPKSEGLIVDYKEVVNRKSVTVRFKINPNRARRKSSAS
ncbi:MAG: hypothetical protein H7Y22_06315 [Gemmatimonadaceae bacterium]|nr:hypothetical protein [Gloeobacterales cyanobacterium ES-bin-141]